MSQKIDDMIAATWKDIPDYEGLYQVSDLGDVRSIDRMSRTRGAPFLRKGTLIKPRVVHNYAKVGLSKHGKYRGFLVHRLVLLTFVGPAPVRHESLHIDGNSLNNRLDNLRWGTPEQNYEDRRKHGTCSSGERNGRAKLTSEIISNIKAEYKYRQKDSDIKALAKKYDVAPSTIGKIIKNQLWNKP